jgi:hypothetical protein
METFEIWQQHHEELKNLLDQAEDAEGKEQQEIFKQIKKALETDAQIVKTALVPGLEKPEQLLDNTILVSERDKQLNALVLEMDNLVSKLKALKEIARHNAMERDRALFPQLYEHSEEASLEKLAQQLAKRREAEQPETAFGNATCNQQRRPGEV